MHHAGAERAWDALHYGRHEPNKGWPGALTDLGTAILAAVLIWGTMPAPYRAGGIHAAVPQVLVHLLAPPSHLAPAAR